MRNDNVLPDWHAIQFDETSCFNIAEEDLPFIKSIYAVYMFDKNSSTYCCEITPSYYMIGLYHCIEFVDDCSDEQRERILNDGDYETCGVDDCYMHCNRIKHLPTTPYLSANEVLDADDLTEDVVRGYWQGNCPY